MSSSGLVPCPAVSAAALREAIEGVLPDHVQPDRRVVALQRRPSEYRTSFALEELDVEFDDGSTLQLMFKNLSWEALRPTAREVKPTFLYDPMREIEMYRTNLDPSRLGTARYYGALIDERERQYWLFLERVAGDRLDQIGDFGVWQQVAGWLAGWHASYTATARPAGPRAAHLIDCNAAFYRTWLQRACAFHGSEPAIEWLAERYDAVIERLISLPRTFIHGEFFASNILVQATPGTVRVCPVDWEMAAIGPGLMDLAALVAGTWTEEEQRALALSYHTALPAPLRWSNLDSFLTMLDCCRVAVAFQWLGWSADWSPPEEHAHDWLADALAVVQRLDL